MTMTPEQLHRASIKALALRQNSKAAKLRAKFTETDHEGARRYMVATTQVALTYRFGTGTELDFAELGRFMAELRSSYRHAEPPLDFLQLEAVIRAAYGEPHLAEELTYADRYGARQCVLRALVDQIPELSDDLDAVITKAQQLMLASICEPPPQPWKDMADS